MTPTKLTRRLTCNVPGAVLEIAQVHGALTAGDSLRTVLTGHLYVLAGRDTEFGRVAGYIGLSHALDTGRPWASLTQWVRAQRALDVDTVALVRFRSEPDLDALRILEARLIRGVTAAGVYTLNSVSSAPTATRALGATGVRVAAYGDFLERVVRYHTYQGGRNPLMTPAGSLRESAVRVVLGAGGAALDTDQVLQRLDSIGVRYGGTTVGATARRDLSIREVGTAGAPRVLTTHEGRRTLYYARNVPREVAVGRYLAGRAA